MRPVIGIIACNRRMQDDAAQTVRTRYVAAAMRHADADALLIPALPAWLNARNIVARLDAVLLTGSPSNVLPAHYGAESGDGPYDGDRDAVMLALVEATRGASKPLFGICRGLQEINVALGGTLRGDVGLRDPLAHHAPPEAGFDAMFEHEHDVALTPGGLFARAFGVDGLRVNSVHYQAVDRLAPALSVEARAGDGVVEAVSADHGGAPLIAVQWHPEWTADQEPASRIFFQLLGRAARGATLQDLAS